MFVNCTFHPNEEAIVVCVNCHKPLCETCRVKVNGRNYCSECATVVESQDLSGELNQLANLPRGLVESVAKVDDYFKEKGLIEEVDRINDKIQIKSSETLESLSNAFKTSREGSKVPRVKKTSNPLDEIKKAKELLDIGAISKEEFEEIKKNYLKMM